MIRFDVRWILLGEFRTMDPISSRNRILRMNFHPEELQHPEELSSMLKPAESEPSNNFCSRLWASDHSIQWDDILDEAQSRRMCVIPPFEKTKVPSRDSDSFPRSSKRPSFLSGPTPPMLMSVWYNTRLFKGTMWGYQRSESILDSLQRKL